MNEQQRRQNIHTPPVGWRWSALALMGILVANLLAGCGGNDDTQAAAPVPSEASATIGAAGGTLDGPDGTQVVIPPQALTQDTVIRIARSSAGAPGDTPDGYSAQGEMYEFTPHDIAFERPVTLRIPAPAAGAASSADVFVASPQKPWHPVESTVAGGFASWQSTGFSWPHYLVCAPRTGDPFPCTSPRVITLAETPTPGVLTLTGSDPFRSRTFALSQAATVQMTANLRAPRDCGDARLTVSRVDRRNNVYSAPQRLVDNLPVSLTPASASALYSDGSHVVDVALSDADNGTASFAFTLSCQRAFQTRTPASRVNDVDAILIVVNAAPATVAPPVITLQPANVAVNVGSSAAFTLAATAPDSLTLDWERSNDAGVTWTSLSSSGTGYSFVAAAVDTGARFRARVCNVRGSLPPNCIFTSSATLMVNAAPVAPAGTKIAAGNSHTCAIRADGSVACWGYNSSGQIGVGDRLSRLSPTTVSLPEATRSVAAGYEASCALSVTGTLRCWGDLFSSTVPVVVGGANGVDVGGIRAVTVGRAHACVLSMAGNVWCRGSNTGGQLGNGTLVFSDALVTVLDATAILGNVARINAYDFRTCAVSTGGSVSCWGNGSTPATRAVQIGAITTAVETAGDCALLANGTETCWENIFNAVSQASLGVADIVSLRVGQFHCGITRAATVQCWGGAGFFGNGQGFEFLPPLPISVNGLNAVGAIAVGGGHTCALRTDATLRCWGSGGEGRLGVGDTAGRLTPTLVPDAVGWAPP